MRFFVGITDHDWFDFLSHMDGLDEVNFWQPSGQQQFRALQIGEPFLFKLTALTTTSSAAGSSATSSEFAIHDPPVAIAPCRCAEHQQLFKHQPDISPGQID